MTTNDTVKNAESSEAHALIGASAECSSQGVFLPIAILMLAVILVLSWNLYISKSQAVIWQKQIVQREQVVSQARTIQAEFQKITHDLMSLSLTDTDAMAIAEKYQIKQTTNTAVSVPMP